MGATLHVELETLSDDDLNELWVIAGQGEDRASYLAVWEEVRRRAELPAETIHEVPAWLARLLPRAMWHQKPTKPEGEGGGTT